MAALYALERLRYDLGMRARVALLAVTAAVGVLGLAGGPGDAVRTLLGIATVLTVAGLPPVYAYTAVLREWSEGTAVWWLPLPDPAWMRLGVKALRGLTLGWGIGLLGGITYLLATVLAGPAPQLAYSVRLFLFLGVSAVPLAALGAALAMWTLRVRRLTSVVKVLAMAATAVLLVGVLGGMLAVSASAGPLQVCGGIHLGDGVRLLMAPLLIPTAAITAAGVWACRWLDASAEVRGPGRG